MNVAVITRKFKLEQLHTPLEDEKFVTRQSSFLHHPIPVEPLRNKFQDQRDHPDFQNHPSALHRSGRVWVLAILLATGHPALGHQ